MKWLVRDDYNPETVTVKLTFLDDETQQLVTDEEAEYSHKPFFYLRPARGTTQQARSDPFHYAKFAVMHHKDNVKNATIEPLYNALTEQKETFIRVVTKTPNQVLWLNNDMATDKPEKLVPIEPWVYANHIEYTIRYLIDKGLHPGMPYQLGGDFPIQEPIVLDKGALEIMGDYPDWLVQKLLPLFLTPIPHVKRAALDIETLSKLSVHTPHTARDPVTSVALCFEDYTGYLFVLSADARGMTPEFFEPLGELIQKGVKLEFFDTEYELLKRVFEVIRDPTLPMLVTFNGDNFDIQYLYRRAERLGFELHKVPLLAFRLRPRGDRKRRDVVDVKGKLHLDLFQFLKMPFVKASTFQNKYKRNTLAAICEALLEKTKYEMSKSPEEANPTELAYYNFRDAELTMELTQTRNEVIIKLIFFLMRLGRHNFNMAARRGISSHIGKLIKAIHIERKWIIPNSTDLKSVGEFSTVGVTADKFKGAIIVPPIVDEHLNAKAIDYASLYPSILKERNISYETLNCPHEQCQTNKVPGTNHWICKRREGILGLVVGFIKDFRVRFWKPLKKIDKEAEVVEQALKVIVNAYYGVISARFSPFFCAPAAEAVTAYGRQALEESISRAQQIGAQVIYGDTDSLFIANATDYHVEELSKWAHEYLDLEFDIDKEYVLLMLYSKKNYLGVKDDGEVDVVGLMGKKKNIPPIIRKVFDEVKAFIGESALNGIEKQQRIREIMRIVKAGYDAIGTRYGSVADYVVVTELGKDVTKYPKPVPHVRAAIELARLTSQREKMTISPSTLTPAGSEILYVKGAFEQGKKKDGKKYRAVPFEFASKDDINPKLYQEQLLSVMSQLLTVLGVNDEMAFQFCAKNTPWMGF